MLLLLPAAERQRESPPGRADASSVGADDVLPRKTSWLLLQCRLQTDKEGIARNTFWLADYRGRKLPDDKAELVAERVADFVVYCTPSDNSVKAQRFRSGPVTVGGLPVRLLRGLSHCFHAKTSHSRLALASRAAAAAGRADVHNCVLPNECEEGAARCLLHEPCPKCCLQLQTSLAGTQAGLVLHPAQQRGVQAVFLLGQQGCKR